MLKIIVVDDNPYMQKSITQAINHHLSNIDIPFHITCFSSGDSLLKLENDLTNYDVFFLDIELEDTSGIKLAKMLRTYAPDAHIIFVTIYEQFAIECYKVNAFRYIIKNPDSFNYEMKECLDALLSSKRKLAKTKTFSFREGTMDYPVHQIRYIESNLHLLKFHTNDPKVPIYTLYDKLSNIETIFSDCNQFIRIHQSYFVNLDYVTQINNYYAILDSGETLKVSRARYGDLKSSYIKYVSEFHQ